MKYLFLLYAEEGGGPAPDSPEGQAVLAAYGAFFQEVDGRGAFLSGDPVQPSSTATTVTEAGTAATVVLLLVSVTTAPPAGAGPFSVTVPVLPLPPATTSSTTPSTSTTTTPSATTTTPSTTTPSTSCTAPSCSCTSTSGSGTAT